MLSMRTYGAVRFGLSLFFSFAFLSNAYAVIDIIAAENIYGEIANELGGPYVTVLSILNNPNQDPHLFTTTPRTAAAISHAEIVIYNGANYDPWIKPLLSLDDQSHREIIEVASLIHAREGDNPHIWYLPNTALVFARVLVEDLKKADPKHQLYFDNQLKQFVARYQIIFKKLQELHQQFNGIPIIATEPIYNYMAQQVGLQIYGKEFQNNIMNDVPPSISQTKAFEDDLYHHTVRLLIYNNQVINPLTERMRLIAEKENIPVLGVNELMPAKITYIDWIMASLLAFQKALGSYHDK